MTLLNFTDLSVGDTGNLVNVTIIITITEYLIEFFSVGTNSTDISVIITGKLLSVSIDRFELLITYQWAALKLKIQKNKTHGNTVYGVIR